MGVLVLQVIALRLCVSALCKLEVALECSYGRGGGGGGIRYSLIQHSQTNALTEWRPCGDNFLNSIGCKL